MLITSRAVVPQTCWNSLRLSWSSSSGFFLHSKVGSERCLVDLRPLSVPAQARAFHGAFDVPGCVLTEGVGQSRPEAWAPHPAVHVANRQEPKFSHVAASTRTPLGSGSEWALAAARVPQAD
jgi:hypothetical protein